MDRRERLNDTEESLRMAIDGRLAKLQTALPGIVAGVNLSAQTITVQPTVMGVRQNQDGTVFNVNLPLLVNVPICFPSAGGYSLTFPIKAGDEVLVIFSGRDYDAWWQSGGIGRPIDFEMHGLSGGFAILAPKSQPKKITNISPDNVQLRNDSGQTFLEIDDDGKIRLSSPESVTIDTPIMYLTGRLQNTTGEHGGIYDAVFSGNMYVEQDVVSEYGTGNISLNTHVHSGVQTGGGNTGEPV